MMVFSRYSLVYVDSPRTGNSERRVCNGVAGYDVAPDGRFLLVIPDESESLPFEMHVLVHIDDVLKRRVR
jgi:hypothetical protein